MCGGAENDRLKKGETYTAPALGDVYGQYRETGRVPYSYYGAGAPTREGELAQVRASYPGAFSTAPGGTHSGGGNPVADAFAKLMTRLGLEPAEGATNPKEMLRGARFPIGRGTV